MRPLHQQTIHMCANEDILASQGPDNGLVDGLRDEDSAECVRLRHISEFGVREVRHDMGMSQRPQQQ